MKDALDNAENFNSSDIDEIKECLRKADVEINCGNVIPAESFFEKFGELSR